MYTNLNKYGIECRKKWHVANFFVDKPLMRFSKLMVCFETPSESEKKFGWLHQLICELWIARAFYFVTLPVI